MNDPAQPPKDIMKNPKQVQLGVIGGSGFYEMPDVKIHREHLLQTSFGAPSDPIVEAEIAGRKVYFLSRHGIGHRYLPSEVNYRANIAAMKMLGVTHLLAVSVVGIMKEGIKPGDIVVPDQIFDRTKGVRPSTFFGEGVVGHVEFAHPFCSEMRQFILTAIRNQGKQIHDGGTYVCMEGPQFSTKAESQFYRATLKPSMIGMTALPEAKLAREAEMSYGMMALATDYDCWHESEETVSVSAVLEVIANNAAFAAKSIARISAVMPTSSRANSLYAAAHSIITTRDRIPQLTKDRLRPIFGSYLES
jgi:5'-methylthioadenosine phosphorylase